jgi:hypothetical protein
MRKKRRKAEVARYFCAQMLSLCLLCLELVAESSQPAISDDYRGLFPLFFSSELAVLCLYTGKAIVALCFVLYLKSALLLFQGLAWWCPIVPRYAFA